MYSGRDKIIKKGKEKATEIEDEVAKALFELENTQIETGVEGIKKIKFTKAQTFTMEGDAKALIIYVPYPLFPLVKKDFVHINKFMTAKFKCPVFIVAERVILSKYGIYLQKSLPYFCREEKGITKKTNE